MRKAKRIELQARGYSSNPQANGDNGDSQPKIFSNRTLKYKLSVTK